MSTPVIPPACDVCRAEPAYLSQMILANYDTIKVGLGCLPGFLVSLATSMIGNGRDLDHLSEIEYCGVCTKIHELMLAQDSAAYQQQQGEKDAAAAEPVAVAAPDAATVAGPPEAAAAVPAEATTPTLDRNRQATATAAQKSLLATFGLPNPDWAQCPADNTIAYTAPGFSTFVCPYCGGQFTPELPAGKDDPPCAETSDGQHTRQWAEGGKCSACGLTGPDPEPPLTPDEAGVPF